MDESRDLVVSAARSAGWDNDKLALIKTQLAPGIDDASLAFFAAVCARTGLDPVMRQIYIIGRNQRAQVNGEWRTVTKWTIQLGIDGLQHIAADSHEWAGVDLPTFGPMDETGHHPEWAAVTVYRLVQGMRVPFSHIAYWEEYAQYVEDNKTGERKYTGQWQKMPRNQLAKCARAGAVREGFPMQTGGIYAEEEMGQADNPRIVESRPVVRINEDTGEVHRRPLAVEPEITFAPAEDAPVVASRDFPEERASLNWAPILTALAQAPFRCRTGTEKMSKLAELLDLDAVQSTAGLTAEHLQRAKDAIFAATSVESRAS